VDPAAPAAAEVRHRSPDESPPPYASRPRHRGRSPVRQLPKIRLREFRGVSKRVIGLGKVCAPGLRTGPRAMPRDHVGMLSSVSILGAWSDFGPAQPKGPTAKEAGCGARGGSRTRTALRPERFKSQRVVLAGVVWCHPIPSDLGFLLLTCCAVSNHYVACDYVL
jgi:hypothetical protein